MGLWAIRMFITVLASLCELVYVTQARVIREEEVSVEKMLP